MSGDIRMLMSMATLGSLVMIGAAVVTRNLLVAAAWLLPVTASFILALGRSCHSRTPTPSGPPTPPRGTGGGSPTLPRFDGIRPGPPKPSGWIEDRRLCDAESTRVRIDPQDAPAWRPAEVDD